jgi:hypothetical protein
MGKSFDWARMAGNRGVAVVRRTPPTRLGDARAAAPGEDPARLAPTAGLVSPGVRIVLWDEWHVGFKTKGDGESPEKNHQ